MKSNHKHRDSCGSSHNDGSCGCKCKHHHHHKYNKNILLPFIPEIVSGVLLIISICIKWDSQSIELFAFIVSLLPVGIPILISTIKEWLKADFFNEFTLMLAAAAGAFLIGEYPEGVAVLLFYSFGEKLEDLVSGDVCNQIKNLLGKMPKNVTILENGTRKELSPENAQLGMILLVKPGEGVALDGVLISEFAEFNTSALTGESLPRNYNKGEEINAGIIPLEKEVQIKITREYNQSSMKRIMQMIEDASAHRAPSETILRKITRWYTPLVFTASILLFLIPWIISFYYHSFDFVWETWFRRSLVFLVCSCPCALIVSIPLSYFASIGIASKRGILFKGHDNLDALRKVNVMLFDKTGTLTTGKFHVEKIECYGKLGADDILRLVASIEQSSKHPLSEAILSEFRKRRLEFINVENVKSEIHGMTARLNGNQIIIGSDKILARHNIKNNIKNTEGTSILVVVNNELVGCIYLSDTLKKNTLQNISKLHKDGINTIGILSGDTNSAVEKIYLETGSDFYKSNLTPADKHDIIKQFKNDKNIVAFAGDGINDAPALAAANVGIAMGGLGTDLAIETAGIIIASDDIGKIHEGIKISLKIKNVIIENVSFSFGVKLAVMILGAFGIASLWAAVFADTGVTLVTVIWTLSRLKIWQLRKKKESKQN